MIGVELVRLATICATEFATSTGLMIGGRGRCRELPSPNSYQQLSTVARTVVDYVVWIMARASNEVARFREIDTIEIPMEIPGWNLAGWYVHQNGEMKLAALAILPGTDRGSAKADEIDLQNPDVVKVIHQSALTSTILEDVQLARLHAAIDAWRIECASGPLPLPIARHKGRPPGKRLPDEDYLPWAQRYVQLLAKKESHPRKVMASEAKVTSEHVRDMLVSCRRRGLLTLPDKGRAGGELTSKAEALIAVLEKSGK